jgi:hypothetical protein
LRHQQKGKKGRENTLRNTAAAYQKISFPVFEKLFVLSLKNGREKGIPNE